MGNTCLPYEYDPDATIHPHACGEYAAKLFQSLMPSVHPHACGEYRLVRRAHADAIGSPPRLWGILDIGAAGLARRRFTPTPVGNTVTWLETEYRSAVHPHACGEYCGKRYCK